MKIGLITGASSGIGKEFTKQIPSLYKKLDELWVVARRTDRLEELKRELEKELEISVRIFDGDLSRDYIYERIEKALIREEVDIRILVNAAGYGQIGTCTTLDAKDQYDMIDLNCKALTRMTLLCLPYCSKGTRIVQVASAAAFAPQPGFVVYAATKSYVYSFSLGLREELKDRQIAVTAVCPGPVDTEFFERAGSNASTLKESLRVDVADVVAQALMDAKKGKAVSVYGGSMKAGRIGAKLLPYTSVTAFMKKANSID